MKLQPSILEHASLACCMTEGPLSALVCGLGRGTCSLGEKRGEVCKELMQGVKGRRYKLWWSGKEDGDSGVGVVVKEELCEKVVEVRRVSDRVMTFVVVFEEEMLRLISRYAPQSERRFEEKQSFYDELKCEWYVHSAIDLVMCYGDFNGYVGRHIDGFVGVHGGYGEGMK